MKRLPKILSYIGFKFRFQIFLGFTMGFRFEANHQGLVGLSMLIVKCKDDNATGCRNVVKAGCDFVSEV